jgi:ArsR family transcriptional regulator, arsenate/arsenite/antimonite-responsive transcriptional repressor / arsenate reductase (thioredoxin)
MAVLATSDYRVRELVTRVDEPQNLVSYHLRLLRDGGLVTSRRSSFDGRDSYYHLDLDRCAEALSGSGAALHPSLNPGLSTLDARSGPREYPRTSVLFICTGNSARSPIAEALLRHHTGDRVAAASAGNRPKPSLHPYAVRALSESFDIDISSRRPRHVDDVASRTFDHVITLCDRARETCPEFPQQARRAHWSIGDPAKAGDGQDGYPAFERATAEIDVRVRQLLPVLAATDPPEV